MAKHKIGWLNQPGTTGETWNPITGCTPVSEGCRNCYAAKMAKRLRGRWGYPVDEPFRVTFHPDKLDQPQRWKKPRTIFVCSMGDLWHPRVALVHRSAVIRATNLAPQHTYIFCTKRPENFGTDIPVLPNYWLNVTAENQAAADKHIPLLLQTRAAVRGVFVEPMLGPVDLLYINFGDTSVVKTRGVLYAASSGFTAPNPVLDWVVIGCESGPSRRPCKLDWVRALVQQCQEAGVAAYVKQVDIDGRVSRDPAEWPEDVRVREWPQAT